MLKVNVYDKEGKQVDSLELTNEIYGMKPHRIALHQAVVSYLHNQRQGNSCTKTKGEVSGGGCKPWRQKGTGRARVGSIRSPLWRKGGITFGPRPRDFFMQMNKKVKKLALASALASKVQDQNLVVIDQLDFEAPKTKSAVKLLVNVAEHRTALVILDNNNKNTQLSFRNLPGIAVRQVENLNVYEMLKHEKFIVTREALKKIEEEFV
ncbi:MAG: 50S ribosomal protein L4 [Candidatus Wallbacteria bacterium]|nr:50S ribosomal protein L4 [Candidatus Wallbacteria bacterium]